MKRSYMLLTIAYCAGIFWMSSQPRLPELAHAFRNEDKLLHASVYAGLAAIVSFGLRRSNRPARPAVQFAVPVAFALLYALSDEIHQIFVPNRHFDVLDILSDLLGALVLQWLLCCRVWRLDFRSR
jgi:VanZ family protein